MKILLTDEKNPCIYMMSVVVLFSSRKTKLSEWVSERKRAHSKKFKYDSFSASHSQSLSFSLTLFFYALEAVISMKYLYYIGITRNAGLIHKTQPTVFIRKLYGTIFSITSRQFKCSHVRTHKHTHTDQPAGWDLYTNTHTHALQFSC